MSRRTVERTAASTTMSSIDPVIFNLLRKLRRKNVRYQKILLRCKEMDKNSDYVIHISDLEDIFIDYLGIDNISVREMDRLGKLIESRRKSASGEGLIDYHRLEDLFARASENLGREMEPNQSRYFEDDGWYDSYEVISYKSGTVGDLLHSHSCPAERRNFRQFILCIEEFERLSGMKAQATDGGFLIPFGPDLQATINFAIKR